MQVSRRFQYTTHSTLPTRFSRLDSRTLRAVNVTGFLDFSNQPVDGFLVLQHEMLDYTSTVKRENIERDDIKHINNRKNP